MTKAHYFERTILAGNAAYRATGRGFVVSHTSFTELYQFHSFSHFYNAVELVLLLLLYAVASSSNHYIAITWAGWLVGLSWLFAPFWFNPMAFKWEKATKDASDYFAWLRRQEGSGAEVTNQTPIYLFFHVPFSWFPLVLEDMVQGGDSVLAEVGHLSKGHALHI